MANNTFTIVIGTDTGEDQAWILEFKSGSWMFAPNLTHDDDYKTNMIWTADDELVFAAGTNSSNTPDFFKYQVSTSCTDGDFGAQDTLEFLTKEFDLELPVSKAKVTSCVNVPPSTVISNL